MTKKMLILGKGIYKIAWNGNTLVSNYVNFVI